MGVMQTIAVAFSLYSAIPMPHVEWSEHTMRYAMVAFPAVGVAVGIVVWAWCLLADAVGFGSIVTAAGIMLAPVIVSGGIHLDGFCDTADAIASHTSRERKLEIMKDSHTGAFAVIAVCCYLIAYFALCCQLQPDARSLWCLGTLYVLVRAASGLAVAAFPCAKDSGLVHAFADAAAKRGVRIGEAVIAVACAVVLVLSGGWTGAAMFAVVVVMFAVYHAVALRLFGGITGDVAGWFLQWAELLGVCALVVCQAVL